MNNRKCNPVATLTLDSELTSFLKTQDNHKFSRFDAYIWLIEHIQEFSDKELSSSAYPAFLVKYTELAKTWHWSRPTVQKFIEGLEAHSVIVKKKHLHSFALSLPDKRDLLERQ